MESGDDRVKPEIGMGLGRFRSSLMIDAGLLWRREDVGGGQRGATSEKTGANRRRFSAELRFLQPRKGIGCREVQNSELSRCNGCSRKVVDAIF